MEAWSGASHQSYRFSDRCRRAETLRASLGSGYKFEIVQARRLAIRFVSLFVSRVPEKQAKSVQKGQFSPWRRERKSSAVQVVPTGAKVLLKVLSLACLPFHHSRDPTRQDAKARRQAQAGFRTRETRPHPNPVASQARHESVSPEEMFASRNVVPQERGERTNRFSSNDPSIAYGHAGLQVVQVQGRGQTKKGPGARPGQGVHAL